MILGYQCDKCKAIHDQVNEIVVYLSDESDVLFRYWICDEHVPEVLSDLQKKFKENMVVPTGEVKVVDMFKVQKSKMGRR